MINPQMHLVEDLTKTEKKSMRDGYGETLLELGKNNPEVVVLVADLKESLRVVDFCEEFPARCIEMGIAEQNMMGVAAGMALSGKIPFVNSLACFSPGRNFDQLRAAVCLSKANVKIIGGHAGVGNGVDGANQQMFEDIAMVRALPNLMVVVPCDYEQIKKAVVAISEQVGPVYMRMTKPARAVITTHMTPFELGKAQLLRKGRDVGIIASGSMVYEALMAAKELFPRIECEVVNIHTIKPVDREEIVRVAQKCKRIVVAEEHQVIGGLGSSVAEVLTEECPVRCRFVGMKGVFGESGQPEEIVRKYGMTKEAIIEAVRGVIK